MKRAIEEEPLVIKEESVSNFIVFKEYGSSGITYTIILIKYED
ncbi:MAG: hypothetical protein ACK4SU_00065 [Dictyoglomus sp.]